ncbi:MAG: RluA family pseudouridine synthase [Bacillales bacterium]|nr:RluA family pseudouridine synthase [Bacillales bacterium]
MNENKKITSRPSKKNRAKKSTRFEKGRPNDKLFKEYIVPRRMLLLDFLIETITFKSRNNIKKLLSSHQILVNGASVSQFDFELIAKDIVTISQYPVKSNGKKESKVQILYEDDELIAINKPCGLLSISDDKEKEKTAYRYVMDYVRKTDPKNRIFVVHRLDKETSGVLIFTKNEELKEALQDKWNDLVKVREYIAICEGIFEKKSGTRVSYLMQTKTNLMYSTQDKINGQKAITHYEVIVEKDNLSLLKVQIDTGKKNQIRVHMKDLGHKIVGDDKYGSTDNTFNRLGLHARILEFDHPLKNKHFKFIADTPKEFLKFFDLKKIK